jgi:geranylgeranyl pyrophosphate synthase
LRSVGVIELLARVIENLVRGETMQMKPPPPTPLLEALRDSVTGGRGSGEDDGEGMLGRGRVGCDGRATADELMTFYLRKNYYKTGSLMANSCRAAALLGGHNGAVLDAAFAYGRHVGCAFQLIDDVLDFEGSTQVH